MQVWSVRRSPKAPTLYLTSAAGRPRKQHPGCAQNGRMLKGNEMRIIARGTLRRFVESRAGHKDQPTLKAALNAWFADVRKADWRSSADVKRLCLGRHRECRPNCVQHQGKRLSTGRVGGLREGIVWI